MCTRDKISPEYTLGYIREKLRNCRNDSERKDIEECYAQFSSLMAVYVNELNRVARQGGRETYLGLNHEELLT